MGPKERFNKPLERCKDDPEFVYEGLLLGTAEKIAALMGDQNTTRKDLAKALSCSPAYITKLLRGSENLTLKKLFDVSRALHAQLSIDMVAQAGNDKEKTAQHQAGEISSESCIHRQRKRAMVAEKRSK